MRAHNPDDSGIAKRFKTNIATRAPNIGTKE
jgi:hypothetical protein